MVVAIVRAMQRPVGRRRVLVTGTTHEVTALAGFVNDDGDDGPRFGQGFQLRDNGLDGCSEVRCSVHGHPRCWALSWCQGFGRTNPSVWMPPGPIGTAVWPNVQTCVQTQSRVDRRH